MTRSRGKQRMPFYGCLRYHKRGLRACRNGLQIRQAALDQAVMDVLVRALDAEVLAAGQADIATRRNTIATKLADIAKRERRLLDALVDDDQTAEVIRGRLRDELARRDALNRELAVLAQQEPLDVDSIVRDGSARAADLRGALGRNIPQARQVLRMLLEDKLVCEPFDEGGEQGYKFTATGTYRRVAVSSLAAVNDCGGPNGKVTLSN